MLKKDVLVRMHGFHQISIRPIFVSREMEAPKNKSLQMMGISGTLLLGILIGSVCQATGAQNAYLSLFVQKYLSSLQSGSFAKISSNTFFSAMLLQTVTVFLAFSCISAPVLICIPLLRGISTGYVAAYLYVNCGIKGLLANLLLLWVPEVLQAALLIFLLCAALDVSLTLFQVNIRMRTIATRAKMDTCLRQYVCTSLGLLLTAMLKGLLSIIFAPVLL